MAQTGMLPEHQALLDSLLEAMIDIVPPGFEFVGLVVDKRDATQNYPLLSVRSCSPGEARIIAKEFGNMPHAPIATDKPLI